ncbi:hypothetical protein N9580_02870 [Flavobacteriales bacterium]|jgi:hypothetical protein|nr:hypothetical protein [Flavobacteriales bacterium]
MKKLILLLCIPFIGIAQTDYELAFNSATLDYVEMPNASSLIVNSTTFSMTGWVYPQANPAAHAGIMGFRNNIDSDFYLLQLQNSNNVEARFRNSAGTIFDVLANNLLDFNQWQHLAFTYDGSNIYLYKNGVLVSSTPANGVITQISQSFKVGALDWGVTGFYMNGALDEIRLWNATLSASTISNWMCNEITTLHPNYTNLVGYWRLNEGVGTTTADLSFNGNNGTFTGLVQWQVTTSCFSNAVQGCTDSTSCNYNSLATVDDFSCYFLSAQINQNGTDLEVIVSSGLNPYSYLWNTGGSSIIITPQQNGIYWVVITDVNGCISDSLYYTVTNITTSFSEINKKKKLIKTIDVLGRKNKGTKNKPLFYIYNDGTVEKQIIIE